MPLTDVARQLPAEVWELFRPLLPPVVWWGTGRPPASNSACWQAVFSVLVSGIAWRMRPHGFPSSKTVQRRLQGWRPLDTVRTAWPQRAHRSAALQGSHGDQSLRDGAKKPAKKGAHRRGRVQWIVGHVAPLCPARVTPAPGREGPWGRGRTPTPGGQPRRSDSGWESVLRSPREAGPPAIVAAGRERTRMGHPASGRPTSGPSGRAAACRRPHAEQPAPAWARCVMPSSAARTVWPNAGGCCGALTGRLAAPGRGSQWPPGSSCSARVLSHSP
jgi:transposase